MEYGYPNGNNDNNMRPGYTPPAQQGAQNVPGYIPRPDESPYAAWQGGQGQPQTGAPYAARPVPGAQPPPPQQPKKNSGAARAIASVGLVLACAVAGFGGGALSNYVLPGENQTVVYRAADTGRVNTNHASAAGDSALSVSQISELASKSVVSIDTELTMTDFFGRTQTGDGAGSGVIISEDGTIITNNHVVEGAQKVTVTLPDGTKYDGTVLGTDAEADIAVVKIDATGLTPAVIGNSDDVAVGDFCLAIGNPLGQLSGTVTNGIISAKDREVTLENSTMTLLQMSAAVSPGNSGGGLFNERGELIGIVNAKTNGNGAEGLGFSIPVNDAMKVAEELIDHGYVSGRPALGISVVTVTSAEEAAMNGLSAPGVYIAALTEGGVAQKAGLAVGDRILSIDGNVVNTQADVTAAIREKQAGDTVELTIGRGGSQMTISAVLGEKVQQAA